jgi:predicted nucleic acid-binding protein
MIFPDTDVMVDLLRQHPPAVAWLTSLGDDAEIALSGFVAMEVIQGCRSKSEVAATRRQFDACELIWPSAETCDAALATFSHARFSHGVGLLDTLIGQTAIALQTVLYTFNQRHYDAIPGLRTEQPYTKAAK